MGSRRSAALARCGRRVGLVVGGATFRIGGDQLLTDPAGAGAISAEDYTVAIVDELEREDVIGRQISVAY